MAKKDKKSPINPNLFVNWTLGIAIVSCILIAVITTFTAPFESKALSYWNSGHMHYMPKKVRPYFVYRKFTYAPVSAVSRYIEPLAIISIGKLYKGGDKRSFVNTFTWTTMHIFLFIIIIALRERFKSDKKSLLNADYRAEGQANKVFHWPALIHQVGVPVFLDSYRRHMKHYGISPFNMTGKEDKRIAEIRKSK